VSRWLPDRLGITLAADRIVVRTGQLRSVDETIQFPEPEAGAVWESACAALEGFLSSSQIKKRSGRLHIALSARLCPAVSVPWQANVYAEADRMQYAMHRFKKLYGDEVAAGEIRLGAAAFGAPVLAASIDRSLLNRLHDIAQSAGCRIASVEPLFTTVFDRHRRAMRDATCFAFAVAERDVLSAALIKNGAWQCVTQCRIKIESAAELGAVLARELHGFDSADMPTVLYYSAPHLPGAVDPAIEELSCVRLDSPSGSSTKETPVPAKVKHAA